LVVTIGGELQWDVHPGGRELWGICSEEEHRPIKINEKEARGGVGWKRGRRFVSQTCDDGSSADIRPKKGRKTRARRDLKREWFGNKKSHSNPGENTRPTRRTVGGPVLQHPEKAQKKPSKERPRGASPEGKKMLISGVNERRPLLVSWKNELVINPATDDLGGQKFRYRSKPSRKG